MKASISILEAFNEVRNNQSFAHDNNILNYHESILIFNNVASAIKFLQSMETDKSGTVAQDEQISRGRDSFLTKTKWE